MHTHTHTHTLAHPLPPISPTPPSGMDMLCPACHLRLVGSAQNNAQAQVGRANRMTRMRAKPCHKHEGNMVVTMGVWIHRAPVDQLFP